MLNINIIQDQQNGFTLIEVMVAIIIAVIVVYALFTTINHYYWQERRDRIEKQMYADIQYAMEYIAKGEMDRIQGRRLYGLRYGGPGSGGKNGGCSACPLQISTRWVQIMDRDNQQEFVYYVSSNGGSQQLVGRTPNGSKQIQLIPSPNSYLNIPGYNQIEFTPLLLNEAFIYDNDGYVKGITSSTPGPQPVVGYMPLRIKLSLTDEKIGTIEIEFVKELPTNVGAGSIP